MIVSSTVVWVSILEFNHQGLALDVASIHIESIEYQSTKSIVVDLLLYREQIVFLVSTNVWASILEFNCHGLALDMNSVYSKWVSIRDFHCRGFTFLHEPKRSLNRALR